MVSQERAGRGLCWCPHGRSQSILPTEVRARSKGMAAHSTRLPPQQFWPLAHQPLAFADIFAWTYGVVPVQHTAVEQQALLGAQGN